MAGENSQDNLLTAPMAPWVMGRLLAAAESGLTRGLRHWTPPEIGDLQKALPQYRVTRLLGCGGMGAVYLGEQKALQRAVAIKVLPPGLEDEELRYAERFQQEARVMARLSHPNIVAVYEAGETEKGLLYFVMEQVEGEDVAQLLAREGRLEPRQALEITAAACRALAFAHEHGIIHRDIKPSNVMIDAEGRVKVMDFGLAKITLAGGEDMTDLRLGMGTPGYAAPEMFSATAVPDHRADLYGAGAMLYHLLTGRPPQGLLELPPARGGGVDRRCSTIIKKALQHDPTRRYATADDMLADLSAILSGPSATRRWQWPVLIGAAALALGWAFLPVEEIWGPAPAALVRTEQAAPFTPPVESPAPVPASRPPLGGPLFDPATPAVSADGWRSVLRDRPEAADRLGITYKGDGWYGMGAGFLPVVEAENAALRLKARCVDASKGKIILVGQWSPAATKASLHARASGRMLPGMDGATPGGREVERDVFGYQVNFAFGVNTKASHLFEGWICGLRGQGGQIEPGGYYPGGMTNLTVPGEEYELELRSFGGRLEVLLDGRMVQSVPSTPLPGRWLAVLSHLTSDFKSLEWRPLTAEGRPVTSVPPPAPAAVAVAAAKTATGSGWRSVLLERPDLAQKFNLISQGEESWMMQKGFVPLMEVENAAIRMRCLPRRGPALVARWHPVPVEKDHGGVVDKNYGFRVNVGMADDSTAQLFSGWINRVLTLSGAPEITGYRYTDPLGFTKIRLQQPWAASPDEEHELELRAFSDRLVVLVNDRTVQEYSGVVLPGKWLGIYAGGPVFLKSLEWRPLTPEGEPLP